MTTVKNEIRWLLIDGMSVWSNLAGHSIQIQPTKVFHNKFNKIIYNPNIAWQILLWQRKIIYIFSWLQMRYNLLLIQLTVVLHYTNKSFWIRSDQSTKWKLSTITFMITTPLERKEIYIIWSIIQDHWQRFIILAEVI